MPVQQVVTILRELAEDGEEAVARRHGPRALGVAQAMRETLIGHLKQQTPYGSLRGHFEEDPVDAEAELLGALEAAVEADAALAQTLDQYTKEYYQLVGPPEAPIADTERRQQDLAVRGEDEEPPIEPSEAEVWRKTSYLYGEVRPGTESVDREVDDDWEEDSALSVLSSFGPGAGTAAGVFKELYAAMDSYPDLDLQLRMEFKAALREIEDEAARGKWPVGNASGGGWTKRAKGLRAFGSWSGGC